VRQPTSTGEANASWYPSFPEWKLTREAFIARFPKASLSFELAKLVELLAVVGVFGLNGEVTPLDVEEGEGAVEPYESARDLGPETGEGLCELEEGRDADAELERLKPPCE
jgi:hypothetical protein